MATICNKGLMIKSMQKSESMRKLERKIQIVGVLTVLTMIAEGFITNKIINIVAHYSMILGGLFLAILCLLKIDLKATETLSDWLENEDIKKLLQESEFKDFVLTTKFNHLIPNWHTGTFDLLVECLKSNNIKVDNISSLIAVLKKHYGK